MSESFSHVPADTQAATRDLQERLARFARNLFVVSGIMLVASLALDVAVGSGLSGLSRTSRMVHWGAQLLLAVVWQACRKTTLGMATIQALDAVTTVLLCATWTLLGLAIPKE